MTKATKPKTATKKKAVKKKTKKLQGMQALFPAEYIIDRNATKAAIRAGYSAAGAQQAGSRLLSNVVVQAEIVRLMKESMERVEMDADGVLRHLDALLNADIADILTPLGGYKPIPEWPLIWRQMLNGVDIQEIFEGYGEDREKIGDVVKIKFVDRLKSLEMLGKHIDVQAFADRKVVETPESFADTLERRRLKAREEAIIH